MALHEELDELEAADGDEERFHELGDVLFAAVNVARKLKLDPELALRSASVRFRSRVQRRGRARRHPRAEVGRISRLSSSSPTTPAHGCTEGDAPPT